MRLEYALKVAEELEKTHSDSDIVFQAVDVIKELVDDIAFIRPVDPPNKVLERNEKIKKIVDFYMTFPEGHERCIREMLEYHWNCMSDYSIDDYVEIVEEESKNRENHETTKKSI
jgi:hypothetical protein